MSDPQPVFDHHFTLAEANALLPWVSGIFGRVEALLRDIGAGPQPALAAAHAPAPAKANGHANGHLNGKQHAPAELSGTQKLERVNTLLAEIIDRGIVIQDPSRGLIDFPAWNGEQEIFLCHEQADGPAIRAWHGLSAGFAGRRPVAELKP